MVFGKEDEATIEQCVSLGFLLNVHKTLLESVCNYVKSVFVVNTELLKDK